MPFTFTETDLPGVLLVTPRAFPDGRGFFLEFYKESEFVAAGIREHFVQDNHSRSVCGVLRGLHYQTAPFAQAKLVRVLFGEILDVAVDIRPESAAYGRWVGHVLSATNRQMLYIPTGFAHGFAVLSDAAEIEYKVTAEYSKAHERGIRWNDPRVGVRWPIADPILSDRDKALPLLAEI